MTASHTDHTARTLPETTHTGKVRLRVADLDRSLAFYRDLVGYTVQPVDERSVLLTAGPAGTVHFELNEVPGVPPKPWRTAGLFHAAIRVPTRRDLACVISRLFNGGWKIDGMADHGVSEAFYLSDPDGNGLEIYRDRERSDWPYSDGELAMVSDPLDINSLFATMEPGDLERTEIPDGSDIGHVHLQVSNLARAEAFYSGVLGFDVMQRSYRGALFVSAGGYHHHIGLNVWAGEGVPGLRDDVAGLIDFTVLLPDAAALDAVAARIEEAGLEARRSDDAGGAPSLLVHDPDGIGVVLAVESTTKH
ncbi:MAG TPA: VOC family protein [Nitrolancea sp.]|nr:VOC family protein [Nitrolancea sp.]